VGPTACGLHGTWTVASGAAAMTRNIASSERAALVLVPGLLRRFQRDGVTHMGIVFLGETMDELFADMELFAQRVVPAFALGHVA